MPAPASPPWIEDSWDVDAWEDVWGAAILNLFSDDIDQLPTDVVYTRVIRDVGYAATARTVTYTRVKRTVTYDG